MQNENPVQRNNNTPLQVGDLFVICSRPAVILSDDNARCDVQLEPATSQNQSMPEQGGPVSFCRFLLLPVLSFPSLVFHLS